MHAGVSTGEALGVSHRRSPNGRSIGTSYRGRFPSGVHRSGKRGRTLRRKRGGVSIVCSTCMLHLQRSPLPRRAHHAAARASNSRSLWRSFRCKSRSFSRSTRTQSRFAGSRDAFTSSSPMRLIAFGNSHANVTPGAKSAMRSNWRANRTDASLRRPS